jgi:hypothetical protein
MSTTGDDPYRIAALQQKGIAQYDLMRPGSGTPWEDRGSSGVIAAFIKTVFRSLFTPAQLLDSLRRPETTTDATAFTWACGIMWSLGIVTNDILTRRYANAFAANPPPRWTVDVNDGIFWVETALRAVLVPVGLFFFLKISATVFKSVSAGELKAVPKTLVQNLFAYGLGPSLLAIIPPWWVGMPVAALWILWDMIIAARKRLYMSTSGAVVASILAWACGVAAIAAACLVVWLFWTQVLQNQSILYEYHAPRLRPGG